MTEKPRRPWFRFSLRTLFIVVTVAAIGASWSAYQLNWIRQRREFLDSLDGWKITAEYQEGYGGPVVRAPWSIRILGEDSIAHITLLNPTNASTDASKLLFPEAKIWLVDSTTGESFEAR